MKSLVYSNTEFIVNIDYKFIVTINKTLHTPWKEIRMYQKYFEIYPKNHTKRMVWKLATRFSGVKKVMEDN